MKARPRSRRGNESPVGARGWPHRRWRRRGRGLVRGFAGGKGTFVGTRCWSPGAGETRGDGREVRDIEDACASGQTRRPDPQGWTATRRAPACANDPKSTAATGDSKGAAGLAATIVGTASDVSGLTRFASTKRFESLEVTPATPKSIIPLSGLTTSASTKQAPARGVTKCELDGLNS